MKKKGYKLSIVVWCLTFTILSVSEQDFVIKKKEPKADKSALKMQCGQALGESIKITPDMLRVVADIQEYGFQIAELMWNDDFFQGVSKDTLQQEHERYAAINKDLEEILNRLEHHKHFLMSQKKKYVQK